MWVLSLSFFVRCRADAWPWYMPKVEQQNSVYEVWKYFFFVQKTIWLLVGVFKVSSTCGSAKFSSSESFVNLCTPLNICRYSLICEVSNKYPPIYIIHKPLLFQGKFGTVVDHQPVSRPLVFSENIPDSVLDTMPRQKADVIRLEKEIAHALTGEQRLTEAEVNLSPRIWVNRATKGADI